ncbi:muconolactone Delta-isomerase [Rhodococcus sp. SJ-3]|uniref:muconolactone Delta-isomerase n=1 Tax=Rhodococcus sp. SJ-3 TaxID=3454628 RepID=UPI003F7AED21
MLFHVRIDVHIPPDVSSEARGKLVSEEKAYSQRLQRAGKWLYLWRIVGEYSSYSIFDVESNEELHQLLSELPLFPYMAINVTPLAPHPSRIEVVSE